MYIVKLYIELVMASLIAKIVKSQTTNHGYPNSDYGGGNRPRLTESKQHAEAPRSATVAVYSDKRGGAAAKIDSTSIVSSSSWNTENLNTREASEEFILSDVASPGQDSGILMTTTTTVVAEDVASRDDRARQQSQHSGPQGWIDDRRC